MLRRSSRRGLPLIAGRARHLLAAAVGAIVLVGLLGAGAAAPATASTDNGSSAHSAFVVQHDATVAVSAANTARSHRVLLAGALLALSGLAAITARYMAARRRHIPRRPAGTLRARLRAPPSFLLVAH